MHAGTSQEHGHREGGEAALDTWGAVWEKHAAPHASSVSQSAAGCFPDSSWTWPLGGGEKWGVCRSLRGADIPAWELGIRCAQGGALDGVGVSQAMLPGSRSHSLVGGLLTLPGFPPQP